MVFQAKTLAEIVLLNWAPGAQGGHHDRHHHGRLPPLLDALLHRQRHLRPLQGLHLAHAFQGTYEHALLDSPPRLCVSCSSKNFLFGISTFLR